MLHQFDDVEIHVRSSQGGYVVDLRLQTDDDAGETLGCEGASLALNTTELLSFILNPDKYGEALSAMLFADERLRHTWAQIEGYNARGRRQMRVRLRLDGGDDVLHVVRWETMRAPQSDTPLSLSERVFFSRFVSSALPRPVDIPLARKLRCVIIATNPIDGYKYGFDSFDATSEIEYASRSLTGVDMKVLTRSINGPGITLNTILSELRKGPHVVYLICHGGLNSAQQPFILLEHEDGRAHPVPVETFALRVKYLSRQPVLMIFTACYSAGHRDSISALAALGPQLVRAGVSAVVGMQDQVPISLVTQLIPQFLSEIRQHGYVDRALMEARIAIREHYSWWSPVLFMRLHDGLVWLMDKRQEIVYRARLPVGELGLRLNEWKIVHTLSQKLFLEIQPIKRLVSGSLVSIDDQALNRAEDFWLTYCWDSMQAIRRQFPELQSITHPNIDSLLEHFDHSDSLLESIRNAHPGEIATITALKNSYSLLESWLIELLEEADRQIIDIAQQLQLWE